MNSNIMHVNALTRNNKNVLFTLTVDKFCKLIISRCLQLCCVTFPVVATLGWSVGKCRSLARGRRHTPNCVLELSSCTSHVGYNCSFQTCGALFCERAFVYALSLSTSHGFIERFPGNWTLCPGSLLNTS
jgi:hypothetical protein